MSFAITAPEMMTAAATQLTSIGSTISAASAAATTPTTGVVAAAADEVSAAISRLFSAYAEEFQVMSTQAAAFHEQFVGLVNSGAAAYLSTEIANAEQTLINGVNAPARTLLGHSLIPTGGSSAAGRGAAAVAGQAVGTATLLSGRVAASVQSVSASLLGAPASLPLLGSAGALAAATPGILGPYQDLIAHTTANLQSLGSTWAANPAPFLRQIIANQMAYGQTIATSLQNGDLSPIFAIPAQIQQNLVNIGNTLTRVTPAVALAATGPPVSTLAGFGTGVRAFTDAVQGGDVVGAFGALIGAPAFVADGFLNGSVTLPAVLPLGLGLLVLEVPFDGILAAPHALSGTLVWFLPPFVDDFSGLPVGGIVPSLLNSVSQELALAITPA